MKTHLFGLHALESRVLVTSYISFFPPTVLAAIRLLIGLYTFVTLLMVLVNNGASFFSYFTEMSSIGICAYFFTAGTQTALYSRNTFQKFPLQRWPRTLQFLHLWLLSTITTFPLLVTVVFWALLASSEVFSTSFSAWSNLSLHAFNSLYALFEIVCTNTPPNQWIYLPLNIVVLGGYVGIAYITHIVEDFYPYPFLDPVTHKKSLPIYIVGIAVAEAVIFVIVHFLVVLRQRLTDKNGEEDSETERTFSPEGLEDWQDVGRPKSAAG